MIDKERIAPGVAGAIQKEQIRLLTDEMISAIQENFKGFYLVFQPLYQVTGLSGVDGKKIVGYEALARWKKATPDVFIPIAEANNLIQSLGEWVIEELLRSIKHLQQFIDLDAGVRFFFNMSGQQICLNGRFIKYLEEVLSIYQIKPSMIGVELTETAIIHDVEAARWIVDHLKGMGVEAALDDFGTGNSGMSRLQELNIGKIKIDRSFVRIDHGKSMTIMKNTLRLADDMGIDVVVEGIETEEQLRVLVEMGFTYFQGFLLGRPVEIGLLR